MAVENCKVDDCHKRELTNEIVWFKSSLVTILTLVKSSTPPTYKQLEEICEHALNK